VQEHVSKIERSLPQEHHVTNLEYVTQQDLRPVISNLPFLFLVHKSGLSLGSPLNSVGDSMEHPCSYYYGFCVLDALDNEPAADRLVNPVVRDKVRVAAYDLMSSVPAHPDDVAHRWKRDYLLMLVGRYFGNNTAIPLREYVEEVYGMVRDYKLHHQTDVTTNLVNSNPLRQRHDWGFSNDVKSEPSEGSPEWEELVDESAVAEADGRIVDPPTTTPGYWQAACVPRKRTTEAVVVDPSPRKRAKVEVVAVEWSKLSTDDLVQELAARGELVEAVNQVGSEELAEIVKERGVKLLLDARPQDLESELRRVTDPYRPTIETFYYKGKVEGVPHVSDRTWTPA